MAATFMGLGLVVHRAQEIGRGVADIAWIPVVAAAGWIIVTKDDRIRKVDAERTALRQSKAGAVILTGHGMKAADLATMVASAYPAIARHVQKFDKPFILGVSNGGLVTVIESAGKKSARRNEVA